MILCGDLKLFLAAKTSPLQKKKKRIKEMCLADGVNVLKHLLAKQASAILREILLVAYDGEP